MHGAVVPVNHAPHSAGAGLTGGVSGGGINLSCRHACGPVEKVWTPSLYTEYRHCLPLSKSCHNLRQTLKTVT